MIAYIVFYFQCDKETCWETIAEAIQEKGSIIKKIVYRGHNKKDNSIKPITPFFSTTPNKKMAELFIETNWSTEKGTKIGNLFKIHLVNVKTINTHKIKYTLSSSVLDELRILIGDKAIQKQDKTYTFNQYIPNIKENLYNLVHRRDKSNDDEILVLNGGKFYKDSSLSIQGYNVNTDTEEYTVREAWYKI